MIEADLEDLRRRRIARDVAADLAIRFVGAADHGERVPAHERGDALRRRDVAGVLSLLVYGDRVSIGRVWRGRCDDAEIAGMYPKRAHQMPPTLRAREMHYGGERFEPLACFEG